MSSPPPGYNAGESMLEGGTATITPVMGGGMLKRAMKQMRKKRTKRCRRPKNKTKRIRKKRTAQSGGVAHYSVFDVDALAAPPTAKELSTSLSMLPTTPITPPPLNLNVLIPEYLIQQAALWTRDVTSAFLGASVKIPILPNSSNVICSTLSSLQYAPDRLCCILPRTTTAIIVLPSVKGDASIFNLIAQSIENDINSSNTPKNRVYIFSPPFYGTNPTTNSVLFNNFLYYRNIGKDSSKLWSFYILTEHTNLSTKAAVDVQGFMDPKTYTMTAYQPTGNQVPLKTLMGSLYTLLEPSYIIYPYAVKIISVAYDSAGNPIPRGTVDPTAASAKLEKAKDRYDTALGVATAAKARVSNLTSQFQAATANVFEKDGAMTAAAKERVAPDAAVVNAQKKIDADMGTLDTYANPSIERTRLNAVIESDTRNLTALKAKQAEVVAKFNRASEAYTKETAAANRLRAELAVAKTASTKADGAVIKAKAASESAGKSSPKPIAIPDADERGGILFSASTKDEVSLPAANRGFNGPINYIQRNNPRGSLAYKPNLLTRDPLLNSLDYQEYSLFERPLMSKQQMFTITINEAAPVAAETKISTDQKAFLGSPSAVQSNIPLVPVAVNSQEYSIRSPLPDVLNDWNNAVYSDDEADYLNALQVSPRILNAIFPNMWKKELAEHLSAISRSKCFTDSRLILNSECQKAQEFISKILNYFMSNSSSILQLQGKEQDAYVSKLKASADAAMKAATSQKYPEGANIFDPAQFIEAFFPGTGKEYLLSISSVKVMRNQNKYTVMYEGSMGLAEKQEIEKETQPFTETPSGTAGTYTWAFPEAQDEHMLKIVAKVYIPSFKVGGTYDVTTPSSSYTVTYRGKISGTDKSLIESKIGLYNETPRAGGPNPSKMCYSWTLTASTNQDNLQTALNTIKNTNIYNCQFTQENDLDYDALTPVIPNVDIVHKRLEKIILVLDLSNPKLPVSATFSSDYNPNGEIKSSITTMLEVYTRIKDSLPTKFGGKYLIIS